jgi:hypothetical protein
VGGSIISVEDQPEAGYVVTLVDYLSADRPAWWIT